MTKKINKETQTMIEGQLRKGTSNSRIANLLGVSYEEALEVVGTIKESIRPELGDRIRFTFREHEMVGSITKLLTNSAVVEINWDYSSNVMKDICEDKTIVNFKDIIEFMGPEDEQEN
ncbi:DUF2187 domain-containing protein [Jeotgalibaca caeni]|uniref:DUF2187 domain-containing protein n=1 Tax=Jeotgalibaca caeni TaxID=3028623 RepID=UPI00237EC11E|nr:DUF2187 domain-containing protein [Jeotgalibaca caeni]MDE1547859.1 DUF2187 domain-containing protein [Jeotgalibaca caeni]